MAARYVLCTMLDEAAADTPWGGAGVWGRHSLLAEFHNEAFGGEKVFQLMARLAEKPDANRDLLELIYCRAGARLRGPLPRRSTTAARSSRRCARSWRRSSASSAAPIRPALASALAGPAGCRPRAAPDLAAAWPSRQCAALLLWRGAYATFAWSLGGRVRPGLWARSSACGWRRRWCPSWPSRAAAAAGASPAARHPGRPGGGTRRGRPQRRHDPRRRPVRPRPAPPSSPEREALIAAHCRRAGARRRRRCSSPATPTTRRSASLRFPVELAPVRRAARIGARPVRRGRRAGRARTRRRPRRRRAARRQRHAGQPRAEPACRGHAAHRQTRGAPAPDRGAAPLPQRRPSR